MENEDYTVSLSSDKSPSEVYQILLNVRLWWSGLYGETFSGSSENLNDVFTFYAGDGAHFSEQKLVELSPNQRIVWLVTDANLTFLENTAEWVGTKLIFEIIEHGHETEVVFTHEGLRPTSECFKFCAPAWTQYMQTKLSTLLN